MERISRLILLSTVLTLVSQHTQGQFDIPNESRLYKYYVGRAIIKDGEIEAFERATKDAYRQAIKENFGVYANYQSDFYGGLKSKSLVIRNREHSRNVFIRDFEQVRADTKEKNDHVYLYILFRYSKAAIRAEKKRLAQENPTQKHLLSEVGEAAAIENTRLKIITHPPQAEVFLNKQRWGVTPIDLKALPPGQYTMQLEHPQYQSVTEVLHIARNQVQTIEKTLKPALTEFYIQSEPTGAEVWLNGTRKGQTPLKVEVTAHDEHHLTIRHSDTETLSRTLSGAKEQLQNLEIELPLKQTFFSINSDPAGAEIYVDGITSGQRTQTPPKKIAIPVGQHQIRLEKQGFEDITIDAIFDPNEEQHFGMQSMEIRSITSIEEPESATYYGSESLVLEYEHRWKYTLGMEVASPTNDFFDNPWYYSMSFNTEYRFSRYIGFIIGGSWDMGFLMKDEPGLDQPQYILNGYALRAAIPIYFSRNDKTWFLSLEAGAIDHTYEEESGSNSYPTFKLRQQRWGVSIGKTMINDFLEWRITLIYYNQKNRDDFQSVNFGIGFNFH